MIEIGVFVCLFGGGGDGLFVDSFFLVCYLGSVDLEVLELTLVALTVGVALLELLCSLQRISTFCGASAKRRNWFLGLGSLALSFSSVLCP